LFSGLLTWLRPAHLVPRFLLLGSSLLAIPGAAQASAIHHHEDITQAALEELGWTDKDAIAIVCHCNVATDFARLPGYSRAALDFVMPATGTYVPLVRGLAQTAAFSPTASKGFHFNSLYSYSDIVTRWEELGAWTEVAVDAISGLDERARTRMSLCLLGVVTHAVQDFYSHSNWVGILDEYTACDLEADEFPLWEELIEGEGDWGTRNPLFPTDQVLEHFQRSNSEVSTEEGDGGLQTGSVRGEEFTGAVPWAHRHKRGDMQDVVHELAKRATMIWVERIEAHLGEPRGWVAKGPAPADD
jgi:hypothetical protein